MAVLSDLAAPARLRGRAVTPMACRALPVERRRLCAARQGGMVRRSPTEALMTRALILLAALATTAASAAPILHGPPAVTAAVLAAEKHYSDNFSRVTVAQGMRDFVDPVDGLAFAGGDPVRGSAAAYAAFGGDQAPANLRLTWVPAEVFAASAGDMAASWGRFTMTDTSGRQPPFTGHYVTVWRKAADGQWKALMDIGEPDAPPEPPPPPGR
jgi:ketosteroid isomerase-like protein